MGRRLEGVESLGTDVACTEEKQPKQRTIIHISQANAHSTQTENDTRDGRPVGNVMVELATLRAGRGNASAVPAVGVLVTNANLVWNLDCLK
jgi:hypothetical protein